MNTEKFTGKANVYEKSRPAYPEAFITYLYEEVGFKQESRICDIGSGTGILSKQLLEMGSKVIAVEPNENMRQVAEGNLSTYSNFTSIAGTAEETTLPEASVDYITVAQAFHWFDERSFKEECQRILKPQGKVVLVWNNRVLDSDLVHENANIFKRYCESFKGFSGHEQNPESFFRAGTLENRTFENNLIYTLESFILRNLSASYAPKEGDLNYQPFIGEIKALFEKYQVNGLLTIPNVTRSYVGEL